MTVDTEAVQGEVVTPPEPLMQGTFALYERPNGSMVLAFRTTAGVEQRRVIPAAMVRMGLKAAERMARKHEESGLEEFEAEALALTVVETETGTEEA